MIVVKTEIERREHFSRYLFGSSVYSENLSDISDIDVAIIYDRKYVSIDEALAYRKEITHRLSEQNSKLIDTILLSLEEEEEMSFLQNSKNYEF